MRNHPDGLPPARILLVDDNKMGLTVRKALLEDQGYQVTTAVDGADALERLGKQSFELVVTDYKMPRLNGIDLIRKIRERMTIPIILISGYAEGLGMTEANTGADSVIPKNAAEVPQLVRTVNRLLKRVPPKRAASRQRLLVKAKGA